MTARASAPSTRQPEGGLISLIVPVYNVERYIGECIDSLGRQDDPDFEVIVVDDGSRDSSISQVEQFASRFDRLVIHSQENRGLGAARNAGLQVANGDFVIFVDSDDAVTPNFVSSLRREQQAGDHDVVTSRVHLVTEALQFMRLPDEPPAPALNPPAMPHELVLGTHAPSISCARLYRKRLITDSEVYFPERIPHEDLFFTYKILRMAKSTGTADDCVYSWRMRQDSLGRSFSRAHVDVLPALRRETYEFLTGVSAAEREFAFAARRNLSLLAWFRTKAGRAERDAFAAFLEMVRNTTADILGDFGHYGELRFPADAGLIRRVWDLIGEAEATGAGAARPQRRFAPSSAAASAGESVFDVAFFPLRAYHLREGAIVLEKLRQRGFAACVVDSDDYRAGNEEVRRTATTLGVELLPFDAFIERGTQVRAAVMWNDWDPLMRLIARAGHVYGAATVGWVEGVNDYLDVDTGRARHAYLRSHHVILPGEFDRKYFTDSRQVVHAGEVVRIKALWESRRTPDEQPRTRRALINSNFSYGVLVEHRDRWVREAVDTCLAHGFQPVVSRHPFDIGTECATYVTEQSFLDAIRDCDLSIQRFGSGILEALAVGVPVIYFNPHGERVDKFASPAGAYLVAGSTAELGDGLENRSYFWREPESRAFLERHAGLNPETGPGDRIVEILEDIVREAAPGRLGASLADVPLAGDKLLQEQANSIGPFYGPAAQPIAPHGPRVLPSATQPGAVTIDGAPRRPLYAPFGDWLKPRSPRLYRALQLSRRAVADIWHHRAVTMPILGVLAALLLLAFLPAFADHRALIWTVTAVVGVSLAVLYVAFRVYESVSALSGEATVLRAASAAANRRAAGHERAISGLQSMLRSISVERKALEARLGKRLDETTDAAKAADRSLRAEIDAVVEAAEARDRRIEALGTRLGTVQSRDVSLDVVSALRAMRPIWFGGSAVEALRHEPLVEHGHTVLMAVLADMARETPGALAGKTLIEIGSTRERDPEQGSTEKLAIFTAMTGMRFVTVDMDPRNTERARTVLRYLNPAGQALTEKGEDYLRLHADVLDAVYLDAFDYYHSRHSEDRQSRYELILHTRINDEECWRMHEACAAAIIAGMRVGGIVALDDTWPDVDGGYAGKGKLAMPLLLNNGFEIVAKARQAIALRRIEAQEDG